MVQVRKFALPDWTTTLALPIATALMAISFPVIMSQSHDIGRIEAKLDAASENQQKSASELIQKIDGLNEKLEITNKDIRSISDHLADKERDPLMLLAKMGIATQESFVSASIDGTVYLFPKDETGHKLLIKGGFVAKDLSPVIRGFEVAPASLVK